MRTHKLAVYLWALAGSLGAVSLASGQTPDWPALYNPFQIIDIQVEMAPIDFAIIQADTSFEIEKPAMLHSPGEESILVSIRRKSGDPIGSKLSYKIDINEYVDGQRWHGVRKLSLENGDDQDVVTEGFSWFIQQQATLLNNGYVAGLANWTHLTVNGQYQGLYVNVEQVDESYFKNRQLWVSHETWLYKQSDISEAVLKEEPADLTLLNTTLLALNYSPFDLESSVPTPDDQTLAAELPLHIYMDGLLTLGAVEGILDNGDALFSHGKNFYFIDYVNDRRRYIPWDMDSAIRSTNASIYQRGGTAYQQYLLESPFFRNRYNRIMLDLIDGPLAPATLIAFLDQVEPLLTPALQADPNSKVGDDVADHFDSLRQWSTRRMENVRSQVLGDMPAPGDANGDGQVDIADFVILKQNYGVANAYPAQGDFNGDSQIDIADFVILKQNYGTVVGSN